MINMFFLPLECTPRRVIHEALKPQCLKTNKWMNK